MVHHTAIFQIIDRKWTKAGHSWADGWNVNTASWTCSWASTSCWIISWATHKNYSRILSNKTTNLSRCCVCKKAFSRTRIFSVLWHRPTNRIWQCTSIVTKVCISYNRVSYLIFAHSSSRCFFSLLDNCLLLHFYHTPLQFQLLYILKAQVKLLVFN